MLNNLLKVTSGWLVYILLELDLIKRVSGLILQSKSRTCLEGII